MNTFETIMKRYPEPNTWIADAIMETLHLWAQNKIPGPGQCLLLSQSDLAALQKRADELKTAWRETLQHLSHNDWNWANDGDGI